MPPANTQYNNAGDCVSSKGKRSKRYGYSTMLYTNCLLELFNGMCLSGAGCLSGPDDDSGPRSCAPPMPSGMRYMQTVNADALNLKVESLQAQLVEQRQLFTEQLEALKQDRQLRQQVRRLFKGHCIVRAAAFVHQFGGMLSYVLPC